ncbi:MAG: aspartate/glutamate racemase family protein [Planctomycetota bacterium]
MRIAITDSGLGGLSVCAEVEARLRAKPIAEDVELVFINAALRDDYGYNSMPTRDEKVQTFDAFLGTVAERYTPDLLYIACNSLSVILHECRSDRHRHMPIHGIVETGSQAILSAVANDNQSAIIVFATPTTVEESTYRNNLVAAGIAPKRIVQQACPDLANAITDDHTGQKAEPLLKKCIAEALAQLDAAPSRVVAFLGCTHYGYQTPMFESLLSDHAESVAVINPNDGAAAEIISKVTPTSPAKQPTARFVTPYPIPRGPLESLPHYLGDKAPATLAALQNFEVDAQLYPQA